MSKVDKVTSGLNDYLTGYFLIFKLYRKYFYMFSFMSNKISSLTQKSQDGDKAAICVFVYALVFYALYSRHCFLFISFYAVCSMRCMLCIVFYALYSMHCILCIVLYVLYSMHCILCIVF